MEGKLYDSITSLTLDRFIKIACENDFSQLFKNEKDFILTAEVGEVWNKIHESFLDGIKDSRGMYKIRLVGKINHLQFVYELIKMCVSFLEVAYSREVVGHLQKHIRVGNFNPEDMAAYRNDLQVVLTRAQGILFEINEKKAELAVIQNGETGNQQTTHKQFDQLIAAVSIYAKFHINKKEITVSEFIEYYTARRDHIEAMEKQYKK